MTLTLFRCGVAPFGPMKDATGGSGLGEALQVPEQVRDDHVGDRDGTSAGGGLGRGERGPTGGLDEGGLDPDRSPQRRLPNIASSTRAR